MADVGIKELLEAGVHFGHQTRRWDPSMRRYIHGERDSIHVIDLLQTEKLLASATEFAAEIAGRGGQVLFVGTKKQARDSIERWATESGMPFVSRRWLGGLLTNFNTISKRIGRLHELNSLEADGQLALLPTKERMTMEAELAKLEFNLGGVRDMQRVPEAMIVLDLNNEEIAVKEAIRLNIPIIALVDTNCDPKPVEFVIPGNDDAIRSCELIVKTLGEAILTSASAWQAAEDARREREAEERRKREEEDRQPPRGGGRSARPRPKRRPRRPGPKLPLRLLAVPRVPASPLPRVASPHRDRRQTPPSPGRQGRAPRPQQTPQPAAKPAPKSPADSAACRQAGAQAPNRRRRRPRRQAPSRRQVRQQASGSPEGGDPARPPRRPIRLPLRPGAEGK